MKNILAILSILFFCVSASAEKQGPWLAKLESLAQSSQLTFVPGEAIVKFSPRISEALRRSSYRGIYNPRVLGTRTSVVSIERIMADDFVRDEKLIEIGADRVYHIVFDNSVPAIGWNLEVEEMRFHTFAADLVSLGASVVEKNHVQWADGPQDYDNMPNDPRLADQWYLERMNVFSLWEMGITGSKDVTFVVMDSGVNDQHEDLAAAINLADSKYFIGGPGDPFGHGTMVAGTCCAVGDNGLGISGAIQDVNLVSLRVMKVLTTSSNIPYALEDDAATLKAYYHVLNNLAAPIVVNNSFGGPGRSELLQEAITAGRDKMLVFASAGNTKSEIVQYPSGYDDVFGVVALEKDGTLAPFSSWGRRNDLGGPGVSIFTTRRQGDYGYTRGTSFASPLTGTVAALLLDGLGKRYLELSVPERINLVRQAIIAGARFNPNLVGKIPNPVEVDALGSWQWLEARLQKPEPEPTPEPEPEPIPEPTPKPKPEKILHHRSRQ